MKIQVMLSLSIMANICFIKGYTGEEWY